MYAMDRRGWLPCTSNASTFWDPDPARYSIPRPGDDCYQTRIAELIGVSAFEGSAPSGVFRCPSVSPGSGYAGQSWNYKWCGAFDVWFYTSSHPIYFRRNLSTILQPMILAGDTADGAVG